MADPLPSISMSNAGKRSYRLLLSSSTGYVAVKNAAGVIKVYRGDGLHTLVIPKSPRIALWPCSKADFLAKSRAPASSGMISHLDCSNNCLCELDVTGMPLLKEFNCSSNCLSELCLLGPTGSSLAGPVGLRVLNCSHNLITHLDLSDLQRLEKANVSNNRLQSLRLGKNLTSLTRLDCSKNRLPIIDLAGLVALEHLNAASNLKNRVNPRGRSEVPLPIG